jgi:plasmid stabilization system protein ParE
LAKRLRTTPQADAHILDIDEWWRLNREKAPDLFEQELAAAFATIANMPTVGKRYAHPTGGVRRVLLRSTRHHVYYMETEETVVVLAVWGAVQGAGPDLSAVSADRQ